MTARSVNSIAKAFTPPGGYGSDMPPPILDRCTDELAPEAPDLRGTWRVVAAVDGNGDAMVDHPVLRHIERIEQAGARVVVTGGGVVHDMVADGTFDNGVNDVMAADHATPLVVAATFEDGALMLRPRDIPGIEVTRRRDGDEMVWNYAGAWVARLERID